VSIVYTCFFIYLSWLPDPDDSDNTSFWAFLTLLREFPDKHITGRGLNPRGLQIKQISEIDRGKQ